MKKLKTILQITLIMFLCMLVLPAEKAYASDEYGNLVIVLDAGHDGTHAGAQNGNLGEEDLVIKIAQYCRQELEKYAGVRVYMTREGYDCANGGRGITSSECNEKRVEFASSVDADLYVSFHLNSNSKKTAHGTGVYCPNNNYRPDLGQIGRDVATKIYNNLRDLGLEKWSDGVVVRNSENNTLYPDGSLADYLGIIRNNKEAGIPAVLIEHVFLSNDEEVQKYLSSEEKLQTLGIADANAIVDYYNLQKKSDPSSCTATGNVEIKNVNTVSGVFDVVISNVNSTDGIQAIEVPVWSANDQSDIVWYKATKQSDGTYIAHVDVANHNCNFGTYCVDTYVKTLSGYMKMLNATHVDLPSPQTQVSVSTNADKLVLKANAWHVPGTWGKSIKQVSFAVWSEENGQDDLKWYAGQLVGDRYDIEAPLNNHVSSGTYYVHVYANYVNGRNEFVGYQTINISNKSTASVTISNVNTVTGSFDVRVSNASAVGGVQKVEVPVWSKPDQSDIVWYTATKQADGTYVAHVDVANHNCNFTKYYVHTYIKSGFGKMLLMDETIIDLTTPGAIATAEIGGDNSKLSLDVWHVPGTFGKSLKGVSFAVWSEENGQDDLRWYSGQPNNDRYIAEAPFKNHSGNGTYYVHVYAHYANGENKFVAHDLINVTAAKANKIEIVNLNTVTGAFDVVVSGVTAKSGVQEVEVPIWSKADQSDIVWYKAIKQNDGTYKVHVDVANHGCNFAYYQVHVYVRNGCGEFVNVGTTGANVNTPGTKTTVSMNDSCSEISLDAWHVPGTFGKSLNRVWFAVWSDNNGQDDIVWYPGTARNDHYVTDIDMSRHSDVGKYHVHVYADRPNGMQCVDAITFDRPLTQIMGTSKATVEQLISFYNANETYPAFYQNSDAPTIEAFCQIYVEECAIEGVRVEVAFAQAMLETGFMRYKGDVDISQYNFAGIGATGGGNPGNSFSSVREGVRAQVQHLKAYASSEGLNQECVDPRFSYVTRESAPYLEWLGIQENPYGKGWATGKNYGYNIRDRYVYKILQ